jgi:hypothetical protein
MAQSCIQATEVDGSFQQEGIICLAGLCIWSTFGCPVTQIKTKTTLGPSGIFHTAERIPSLVRHLMVEHPFASLSGVIKSSVGRRQRHRIR